MSGRHLVEVSLDLPENWFEIPVTYGADEELVDWATGTALAAWQLRAAAGFPEEAVFPDAGRNVAVELAGIALGLRAQLSGVEREHATAFAWVPLPEMGFVSAVVVAQLAERSPERSPERFTATLEELSEAASGPLSGDVHRQRVEGDFGGDPLRGLHSMVGHFDPEAGVAVLEERICFGIFPRDCAEMVEVLFIAERPAAFEDMPSETYALLDGLRVGVTGAA